jgi:23S rRNA (adenine2030-N6)-methyltransferase
LLSYRHAYHAGNFGDVIKHIVLIEILEHLIRKDTPFEVIDTHAGAGLYHLHSEHGAKLNEYEGGIGKLNSEAWPELASYFRIVARHNPAGKLVYYPGSPLIAMEYLRDKDRGWFFELHSTDVEMLRQNTATHRRIKVLHEDGFAGLLGLLPPASRRGLILVDPSYEIKSDYNRVFDMVAKAYKKSPTCSYAVWYPVVDPGLIRRLEKKFVNSGIKKIEQYELRICAELHKGMTASGMIVINPPWQLRDKMASLLPRLAQTLAEDKQAGFKCEVLVGEN